MDEGFAVTPFIQSVESLHALSADSSTLFACAEVRDMSTTAAACSFKAVAQLYETGEDFGLFDTAEVFELLASE